MLVDRLPALDLHAHIATDVTESQLAALGDAMVVAMTRSLSEAEDVCKRRDANLIWACGIHPAAATAVAAYDGEQFRALLDRFAVVGEVGLDRRAGSIDTQVGVFSDIVVATAKAPVLLSVHASGQEPRVVKLLEHNGQANVILHWFLGSASEVEAAVALGCYFSVNAAMGDDRLATLPRERVLPETDFPATKRLGGGDRPGDTSAVERKLAGLWNMPRDTVRRQFYRNLRDIADRSGAIDRLPSSLVDHLLAS
jgi:TatD DNase family protein